MFMCNPPEISGRNKGGMSAQKFKISAGEHVATHEYLNGYQGLWQCMVQVAEARGYPIWLFRIC